ncbi:MAG: hypothetical protein ACI4WS_01260 [Oscillospiraceae bacterium]
MDELNKSTAATKELSDEKLDTVNGGSIALGDYDEGYQLKKCPYFEGSNYVNSILNNSRVSDTAKSAIRAELGRCSKCKKIDTCTLSNEEKIEFGGLSFWDGKL